MRRLLFAALLVACNPDDPTAAPSPADGGIEQQGPPKITITATVSVGDAHGCRVAADGALTCWGESGAVGRVGDGTTEDRPTPVPILPSRKFASVSVGPPGPAPQYAHTCAIGVDGALFCWGGNIYGQLGDGTKESRSAPVRVGSESNWTRVSAGHDHTCALKEDGSLYCFGWNLSAQLGDGTRSTERLTHVRVGTDSDWKAIACGTGATCAVKANGSLWCWGNAGLTETQRGVTAPVQIGTDLDWATVHMGNSNACALKTNGRLLCWGGKTGTEPFSPFEPHEVDDQADWATASSSGNHLCGVKKDGRLLCWGSENRTGALGNGTTKGINLKPAVVGTAADWDHVSTGLLTTCGVKRSGEMWCWGGNQGGAVATGVNAIKTVPTQVGLDADWAGVAAGSGYTCATKANGSLWCFGDDEHGQVAEVNHVDQLVPARVGVELDWGQLTAGTKLACGLRGTKLWCWGRLFSFENLTPYQPNITDDFVSVVAGDEHTGALRADGVLFGWGSNGKNQINGTSTLTFNLPVQMATGMAGFSGGGRFSCVRAIDNTIQCAGYNVMGQLGNGTVNEKTATFTPIAGGHTWRAHDSGNDHTCAIESNGTLWCWGLDAHGRLGLGPNSAIPSPLPRQVGTANDWTQVSAGGTSGQIIGPGHTCGVRADGSLWCWGDNDWGQLGDGSRVDRDVPTRVGTDADWASVSTGALHTCARKTTSTLWCWGRNQWGDGGDGTALYTSPIKSL